MHSFERMLIYLEKGCIRDAINIHKLEDNQQVKQFVNRIDYYYVSAKD